jgi:quercetin dioxygenase-like cupin family protein
LETWDISSLDVEPHHPEVLRSDQDSRAIALNLPAGESLQEHETHERAYLVVIGGEVEVSQDGAVETGTPGFLAHFKPHERREVKATKDSRIILLLSPYPAPGRQS